MDKVDPQLNKSGQATVEYILLLAIVIMTFIGIEKLMEDRDWYKTLTSPLTKDYKNTYQWGHPKADGEKNVAQNPDQFRVFVNPQTEN